MRMTITLNEQDLTTLILDAFAKRGYQVPSGKVRFYAEQLRDAFDRVMSGHSISVEVEVEAPPLEQSKGDNDNV